ncbi:hypothetical protein WHR41_09376 [Cladosporium halotolerans]|uniref:Amino acid transporter n=1 Tax=Cladosporium halotolerans TaxID=1052096 RepID=A0AB34KAR4_9PEZI
MGFLMGTCGGQSQLDERTGAFEMGPAVEAGGLTSNPRTASATGNDHEKARNERDRMDMRRIGKSSELKRCFKGFHLFAFALILGNTSPWAFMSMVFSLTNGGTAGAIWMFVIVAVLMLFVVLSMAEMASMAPTAGGQYREQLGGSSREDSRADEKTDWVSEFAAPKFQKFMSYMAGWYALLGWQTSLVGTALAAAQLFQAVIVLYNPWFASKGWIGTLITIGLTCLATFINVFAYKKLPILEGFAIPLYVFVFIAMIAVFWVMGDRGGEAVFTTFSSNGWQNDSVSCMVGILAPVITLIGSDSQAHLSEETLDAARVVPRAMVATALANYSFGLASIVTAMCVLGPDIDAIRNTRTGVPVVELLLRTTGSVSATVVLTCLLGLLFVCCLTNNVTTASRQLWSFARDKGVPFHQYFSWVSPTKNTPMRSTVFTLLLTCVLSLFNTFSAVALTTLTSLSLTGLISSYLLTVVAMLSARIRRATLPPSRFDLGPVLGFMCNAVALIFLCVVLVMMFFPTTPKPEPADMNWSVVMYGFVTVTMLVFYFRRAKYIFDGPVTTVSSQWNTATSDDRTVSAPASVALLKALFPKLAKIL